MHTRRAFTLLALSLLLAGWTSVVGGGEATEQLRKDIDELYRTTDAAAPGASSGRSIVERMFDWPAMAESALRGHWAKRTPAERTEFTRMFSDLFARAYVSRMHLVDASTFQYLGDTTTGDRGTVKTRVATKRGSTLDLEYLVHAAPTGRWLVQDVRVEGISLIDSYRSQFDAIIAKSSFEDLVKRLQDAGK